MGVSCVPLLLLLCSVWLHLDGVHLDSPCVSSVADIDLITKGTWSNGRTRTRSSVTVYSLPIGYVVDPVQPEEVCEREKDVRGKQRGIDSFARTRL